MWRVQRLGHVHVRRMLLHGYRSDNLPADDAGVHERHDVERDGDDTSTDNVDVNNVSAYNDDNDDASTHHYIDDAGACHDHKRTGTDTGVTLSRGCLSAAARFRAYTMFDGRRLHVKRLHGWSVWYRRRVRYLQRLGRVHVRLLLLHGYRSDDLPADNARVLERYDVERVDDDNLDDARTNADANTGAGSRLLYCANPSHLFRKRNKRFLCDGA